MIDINSFASRHIGPRNEDISKMLEVVECNSLDDLIQKTKISSRLLFKDGINSNNYHVDVVNNEVYVMGLAENLNEKNEVENFLSSMPDIKNLITIIEIPKHTDR